MRRETDIRVGIDDGVWAEFKHACKVTGQPPRQLLHWMIHQMTQGLRKSPEFMSEWMFEDERREELNVDGSWFLLEELELFKRIMCSRWQKEES